MNIGLNPTIDSNNKQSIEIHLFNFNESIYHKTLTIELLDRIREEQKFDSVEDLKIQLQKDKETSLSFIKSNHAR
jgi:riboflavin kinase/FMN adenylyltransferase